MSIECYENSCFYHSKDEPYCSLDDSVIYCHNCGEPLVNLGYCVECGEEVNRKTLKE